MTEDLGQKVAMMRHWSDKVGGLHEGQVFQLKAWPLILFEDSEFELQVDIPNKTVSYVVSLQKDPLVCSLQEEFLPISRSEELNERAKVLALWIKELLGEGWDLDLDVQVEDKTVFAYPD